MGCASCSEAWGFSDVALPKWLSYSRTKSRSWGCGAPSFGVAGRGAECRGSSAVSSGCGLSASGASFVLVSFIGGAGTS